VCHIIYSISELKRFSNIPTPGEVIWYAHHNPVTRWYEGCILIYIFPVKKRLTNHWSPNKNAKFLVIRYIFYHL